MGGHHASNDERAELDRARQSPSRKAIRKVDHLNASGKHLRRKPITLASTNINGIFNHEKNI